MNPKVFAYQAVPPTESGSAAPSQAPSTEPDAPAGPGSSLFMFLMFVPLILLLFWQTRSQAKKQEKAVAELKKGDRVVTQSGLVGRLLEIDSRYARLELAPGVKVQVLRTSLSGRDTEDSAKAGSDDKSAKDKSAKEDAEKTKDK